MKDQIKFLLGEEDLPKYWYNLNADSQLPLRWGKARTRVCDRVVHVA